MNAEHVVLDAVRGISSRREARHVLVVAPPGFGKTSVLGAALRQSRSWPGMSAVWIQGSVVASEGHFFDLLLRALDASLGGLREWSQAAAQVIEVLGRDGRTPTVLLIDDLDQLTFKREELVAWLSDLVRTCAHVLLVGTCRPGARDRLVGDGRPLARAFDVTSLGLLEHAEATALVQYRAPSVGPDVAAAIAQAAGGHPAALVFLSRLVELRTGRVTAAGVPSILERAAELAGAVYAEQWGGLGPQQRAILWQLGAQATETHSTAGPGGSGETAATLAAALVLSPSHVSAQLTRLGDEGLVYRLEARGRFAVAPLLASWIRTRATRGQADAHRDPPAQAPVQAPPPTSPEAAPLAPAAHLLPPKLPKAEPPHGGAASGGSPTARRPRHTSTAREPFGGSPSSDSGSTPLLARATTAAPSPDPRT